MKKIYNSKQAQKYYDINYKKFGSSFQRKYPNEELCRFIGRNFNKLSYKKKGKIKVLEVGCGSAGNLWMLAEEGFNTYGIDYSKKSIDISKKIIRNKNLNSKFAVCNMKKLPFRKNYFNCIVDIFSSTNLNSNEGNIFLKEVSRTLKKGGLFFSYFPSKNSKMFKSKNKVLIDKNTIFNLKEKKSVYKIKNFPFRFHSKKEYKKLFIKNNLKVIYSEELKKTYFNGRDNFDFLVFEGLKK